ncbi:hypothetical protein GIB67_030977 [Kingdonia uniflora]|uniref:Cytochrome P450 n=1 Tax=Kingdonia uniflora TaxID=39325 RepID=A0A7J7L3P2_9MAGN|nr:hypothetical protein GIB67_030977 [Kingdonia uniflora]
MIKSISLRSSCVVNLNEKLNLLVHTVILRIALGTSYEGKKFESGGNLSELLHGAIAMMGAFSVLSLFPYVGRIIALFTGLQQKLDNNFNELDALLQQAVDEYSDPDRQTGEYEDIVDVLLRLEKEQFGEIRFTKYHIKAILMDMYLGGSNTSSVILVWTMSEHVKNPRVMKKVQEEVRRCVGKKEKVDENDLDQLHYLKMVIKESLRKHPPGSILIPRECMSRCIINGYDIYPKAWVLINIWAIARDPVSWKNPEEFLPERFIDCRIDFKGKDFEFLPFGAGRRGFPGMSLGVAIIELALANLLYSFNWELPPGITTENFDMEETGVVSLEKKSKLQLVPIKYEWEFEEKNFM